MKFGSMSGTQRKMLGVIGVAAIGVVLSLGVPQGEAGGCGRLGALNGAPETTVGTGADGTGPQGRGRANFDNDDLVGKRDTQIVQGEAAAAEEQGVTPMDLWGILRAAKTACGGGDEQACAKANALCTDQLKACQVVDSAPEAVKACMNCDGKSSRCANALCAEE